MVDEQYFGLIVMSRDPFPEPGGSDVLPDSLVTAIERNYRTVNRFTCRDAGVMLQPIPNHQPQ